MSTPEGVRKKWLSISTLFSKVLKTDSNPLFLIKHHLGEIGIIKKLNKILIGKTPVKWNAIYYSYQNLIQLVVLTCWKRCTFQISMKFNFKKKNLTFETLFSPSFDVLYSSPIVLMDHTELIFQDLLLYCTKKVAENQNNFLVLLSGGWNTLPGACSDHDGSHQGSIMTTVS